jgi:hypothetical protein
MEICWLPLRRAAQLIIRNSFKLFFLKIRKMNPFGPFRPVAAVVELFAGFERANPKRAQRGLWGGKIIYYGNSVSFSNSK